MVVCILACLIWFVRRLESTGDRKRQGGRILQATAEEINYFMIERGNLRVDCARKDGTWFIVKPLEAWANEAEMDRILSVLEAMPCQEIITAAQRRQRELTLDDYGLLEAQARFVVSNRFGCTEMLVGCDAPLGNLLYVKLTASDDVIATSRDIMDVIPDKIEDLRDRTVLHGDEVRTSRLEIQRADGGFIQLIRTGTEWLMQQPIVARVDMAKLSQVLNALYSLEVQEFVWDAKKEPADAERAIEVGKHPGARLEPYQLAEDEAVMRTTTWVNGYEVGKELFLGKQVGENTDKIYARCRDINSIFTVKKDILDVLSISVNDLRDKNLFSIKPENVNYVCFQKGDHKLVLRKKDVEGWVIMEPVQWKADDQVVLEVVESVTRLRVESFADGSQTNLAELGLDPPACMVQVLDSYPETAGEGAQPEKDTDALAAKEKKEKNKQNRLRIGTFPEGRKTVFVMFEDESCLFEVSTAVIGSLAANPTDPLVYRDRTMFALRPENVKSISLFKNGKEQTVARDVSRKWIAVFPATNQVDQEVVDDIIFAVSNMRALRIESHNPENLAALGLDHSKVALTLGLSGEKGIQKTLMMGFRSKTDGIYAMVQGLDVVFSLENALVDLLTRDLTKSPVPSEVSGPAVGGIIAPGARQDQNLPR